MERPAQNTPAWAERLVRLMDDGFRIPGTQLRFGLDALLGLIFPGVGDAFGAASTLSLFALALRRGLPRVVLLRMALNVGADAVIGAVPVLGDLFDLGFKANRKNLRLIEEASADALTGARPPRRLRDWLIIGTVLLVMLSALCLPLVVAGLVLRACLRQ
ncbi:MAG TPA: DUF4112 domain-containing protein [Polyangiaceae bacterium]|nr:DUF4112 domain-containing protein [Polyangiaceae bacterium]